MSTIFTSFRQPDIWNGIKISLVLFGIPIFFYFDSPDFNHHVVPWGQMIANSFMLLFYVWFFLGANNKLRWLLIITLIIGAFGEVLASIVMTLYRYRLGNIPLYVPMGHAIVYATVYYLQKQPVIRRQAVWLKPMLQASAALICVGSLLMFNDVNGFMMYLAFLVFLRHMKNKLFYWLMFAMVFYLEVIGTRMQAWTWYGVLGNHPMYLPVANPPAGVAVFYMMLDILTNHSYIWLRRMRRRRIFRVKVLSRL